MKYWEAEEGRRCRVCGGGGNGVVETCTGQVCGWRRGGKGIGERIREILDPGVGERDGWWILEKEERGRGSQV